MSPICALQIFQCVFDYGRTNRDHNWRQNFAILSEEDRLVVHLRPNHTQTRSFSYFCLDGFNELSPSDLRDEFCNCSLLRWCRGNTTHSYFRWVFSDERMSEYFTGSNPLIRIDSERGLQELDTLLSLSGKSIICQVILTIMSWQSIIATMKVTSYLLLSRRELVRLFDSAVAASKLFQRSLKEVPKCLYYCSSEW